MFILAEADKHKLSEVDPKTIMRHRNGLKRYMDLRTQKENLGKLSWTIGLYGTESMAQEAGLSTEEYWNQMIKACFLDKEDPIATWKAVYEKITVYKNRLNSLGNCRLHVTGPDTDLWIKVGEDRLWKSGSGANIPSFEIFTSPDWRGTEGHIKFNQPLYYMSQKISGISMKFEKGHVVSFDAKHNKATLAAMLATENADKVGEFSLTDGRFSNITKFMAETLYDENMGGEHGNTHIALGKSYLDTYAGDVGNLDPIKADSLGFNNSIVHTDIISTAPREVTAVFADGTEKVIYAEGKFVL
jgi:aminopeptidase